MFSLVLHLLLISGILTSLSIFLKLNIYHVCGETFSLFSNSIAALIPLDRGQYNTLCILVSIAYCVYDVYKFGSIPAAFYILLNARLRNDSVNRVLARRLFISTFTLLIWLFIKVHYSKRDKFHAKVLEKQKQCEIEFLKTKCIKIK